MARRLKLLPRYIEPLLETPQMVFDGLDPIPQVDGQGFKLLPDGGE